MSDTSNRDTRRGRPRPMHRRDDGHQRDGDSRGNDTRGNDSRGNYRDRNGDTSIDRELLAELEREEPLSLAEELDKAAERVRRVGAAIARDDARMEIAAIRAIESGISFHSFGIGRGIEGESP